MYRILVVDDQHVEVETVSWLIMKHKLPLKVSQAFNGKEALEHLNAQPFDILFTDIKMPFMDGIELARCAKKLQPSIRIIMYSAYGEFQYAQQAIEIGVQHYIMKPLAPSNFIEVIEKVIEACDSDLAAKMKINKLQEGYEKVIRYERESLFHALLHGYEWSLSVQNTMINSDLQLDRYWFQMIFVDTRERLFDTGGSRFEKELANWMDESFVLLHLNERQSVVIVLYPKESDIMAKIAAYAKRIKQFIDHEYVKSSFIVIGRPVHAPALLCQEFDRMEEQLDYRFYVNGSTIWDMNDNREGNDASAMDVESELAGIYRQIEASDYYSVRKSIDVLVNRLRQSGKFSPLYAKLLFSELVRKLFRHAGGERRLSMAEMLDQVAKLRHIDQLQQLSETIIDILNLQKDSQSDEQNRKVVQEIVEYIADHYGEDIGLEQIASHFNFSPSHMAYLFKGSMGKSMGKYITELRLESAAELLVTTFMKVAEIGRQVGYPHPSYFAMLFKNRYGMTPAQYREKVR